MLGMTARTLMLLICYVMLMLQSPASDLNCVLVSVLAMKAYRGS
jgi:hypothetical protein